MTSDHAHPAYVGLCLFFASFLAAREVGLLLPVSKYILYSAEVQKSGTKSGLLETLVSFVFDLSAAFNTVDHRASPGSQGREQELGVWG